MVDDRDADRYRTSVTIAASPLEVFRCWVDPDLLASWLGISVDIDPRPDGTFRFEVAPGEWCAGEYLELEPPRRLVLTWGWESGRIDLPPGSSRVEVVFTASDGGTRLELVHSGLRGDVLRLHADGWPRFLARLQAAASGMEPGPSPAGETPEQALVRMERREPS